MLKFQQHCFLYALNFELLKRLLRFHIMFLIFPACRPVRVGMTFASTIPSPCITKVITKTMSRREAMFLAVTEILMLYDGNQLCFRNIITFPKHLLIFSLDHEHDYTQYILNFLSQLLLLYLYPL